MYISLLTDDYLKPSGRFTRNFVKESREAPAVFKYNGKYYMLSSGCTGWDPNVAEIAVADSIMGTWKTIGNPCTGPDADKTEDINGITHSIYQMFCSYVPDTGHHCQSNTINLFFFRAVHFR